MDTMALRGPVWTAEGKDDPRARRRGIVFTRSTGRCDALFGALDASFAAYDSGIGVVRFHSQMSEDERKTSFTYFTSAEPGLVVMVATTAAGVSLDHDRVRWTIHEGGVYGDNNLVQETGRAGRDGKPALALLLVDDQTTAWMLKLEREALSSAEALLLHEHYPPVKARSISRARRIFEYGAVGGKLTAVPSTPGAATSDHRQDCLVSPCTRTSHTPVAVVCIRAYGHEFRDGFGASCIASPPGTMLCSGCRRAVRNAGLEDTFPPTLVPPTLYPALGIDPPGT